MYRSRNYLCNHTRTIELLLVMLKTYEPIQLREVWVVGLRVPVSLCGSNCWNIWLLMDSPA